MAAEYTTEPSRDGEGIGRETSANGQKDVSESLLTQDLRAAAAESEEKGLKLSGAENAKELCSDSNQSESRTSEEKSSGQAFYKSQREVDRAFGRRLAAERRRWEREHQEKLQQVQTAQADEDWSGDSRLAQKKMDDGEYTYFADLVAQANTLAEASPEFDLMDELNNNASFERMVANGVPVEEAYETVGQTPLLEKEETIRQDERRRIMEEMESRTQSLPPVDHDPGLSGPALDVTRITEEELIRLAERVRKGERVVI